MLKLINRLIFDLDISLIYIIVKPKQYPSKTSYKNVTINIAYSFFFLKFKHIIKYLLIFIFLMLIDFLKIVYFPITILIYFSKYRFIQLNYSQIGTLNQNLNFMVKKNILNGYKSIILIPSHSNYSFVKKIFKNLIIIDNLLLNILLLPMKHSSLISCMADKLDPTYLNSNLQLINTAPMAKVYFQYKKRKKDNLYDFNDDFKKKMKFYMEKNCTNFKMSKTFVFHHREKNFLKSSHLRGSELSTYVASIKYLLSRGYGIIRLTHSKSKKLIFKNKLYKEINTDLDINKSVQYYIIAKCKGFICCDSGPAAIGALFSKPTYNTNIQGTIISAVTKKSIFIIKKIKLRKKLISYKRAIDLCYFQGKHLSISYIKKHGYEVVDNNKNEILQGLKEFESLNIKVVQTKKQYNFKKSLPDYFEFKHYNSNISDSFIRNNARLFFNLNLV